MASIITGKDERKFAVVFDYNESDKVNFSLRGPMGQVVKCHYDLNTFEYVIENSDECISWHEIGKSWQIIAIEWRETNEPHTT